ncbi:MAG: linear amide C-N hydrolase [Cyanobacteriota bacterium]|nr:linear amide C-N hydrolase [Cyanobacteriota bacterium]
MRRQLSVGLTLSLLGISAIPQRSEACTGKALTAAAGSVVVGRSLEFGQPLDSQIAIGPAGSSLSGSSTSGALLRYRSRYGFVGATAANHSDRLLDGLNEKSRNVGMVNFPDYAQYTPAAQTRPGRIMAPLQITAQGVDLIGIVPDMPIKVQDAAAGSSIVIEPVAAAWWCTTTPPAC